MHVPNNLLVWVWAETERWWAERPKSFMIAVPLCKPLHMRPIRKARLLTAFPVWMPHFCPGQTYWGHWVSKGLKTSSDSTNGTVWPWLKVTNSNRKWVGLKKTSAKTTDDGKALYSLKVNVFQAKTIRHRTETLFFFLLWLSTHRILIVFGFETCSPWQTFVRVDYWWDWAGLHWFHWTGS